MERLDFFFKYYKAENFNARSLIGTDEISIALLWKILTFNSRSLKGSDITAEHANEYLKISIHAPSRGATQMFA